MKRWHRVLIYWLTAALFVSGWVWLLAHWWPLNWWPLNKFRDALEVAAQEALFPLALKVKYWSIRAHALLALVVMIAFGSLIVSHMVIRWRRHQHRGSGGLNAMTVIILIVTSYLLWYGSEGPMRDWASTAHYVLGSALPITLLVHVYIERFKRKSS